MESVRRYFFFQAEDGIRDLTVTGVQTCALPISVALYPRTQERHKRKSWISSGKTICSNGTFCSRSRWTDRKSTRLNSSHSQISYAVFCLKKKNHHRKTDTVRRKRDDRPVRSYRY